MSRKRKSVRVDVLKDHANTFFRVTKDELRPERRAIASFIETVLHSSGNYKGFRYLEKDEVWPGYSYGIDRSSGENKFPDDSRVSYY